MDFRIMIVEDNAIIAMGMEKKINSWGYTVGPVVSSGEDAVEASYREKPDLIVMDIGVKGEFNGIEASRRINNRLEIPIIYLTGRDDAIEEALETVPYALLKKPVSHEVLKQKIRSALDKRIKNGKIGRK